MTLVKPIVTLWTSAETHDNSPIRGENYLPWANAIVMIHFPSPVIALSLVAAVLHISSALSLPPHADVIDLQAQHHVRSPIETLKEIEEACETLNILDFDTYGDFEKG